MEGAQIQQLRQSQLRRLNVQNREEVHRIGALPVGGDGEGGVRRAVSSHQGCLPYGRCV